MAEPTQNAANNAPAETKVQKPLTPDYNRLPVTTLRQKREAELNKTHCANKLNGLDKKAILDAIERADRQHGRR